MKPLFCILFILFSILPVSAETPPGREVARAQLLANLKAAKTEDEGRAAEDAIRYFWLKGPTIELTSKLLAAMQARRYYDLNRSLEILNDVISRSPDYMEAYNQRAFVYFLQQKFDAALEDLNITLQKEPMHFGALTGRAIIFIHQGRMQLARTALAEAVAINPWLRERSFLNQLPS